VNSEPIPDTSDECLACKTQVSELDSVWTNQTEIDAILKNLDKECFTKYKTDPKKLAACKAIASVFVQIPPVLFQGMDDLAWPIPDAVCATLFKCDMNCCGPDDPPEQVHLSMSSSDLSLMGVTWVTLNIEDSVVQYGLSPSELSMSNSGVPTTTYKAASWIGTIHRAQMTELIPGKKYYYRVGNGADRWSEVFDFTVMQEDQDITYAIIGDLDFEHLDTIANVNSLVASGKVQAVIHTGDESYADGYEPHWDLFFNLIQPWAARVPYMAAPGNHEFWYNFSSYKQRFYFPGVLDEGGSGDNMFYSFNAGHTHWSTGNSETKVDTPDFSDNYLEWLEADLSSVDRSKTPFVVVNVHRPLYCSNDRVCSGYSDGWQADILKDKAEEILIRHKVDLVIVGHIHAYERTYPVAYNASTQHDYVNPSAPVYIVQGGSGNRESNKGPYHDLPEWSAANDQSVGFGLMTVRKDSIQWGYYAVRPESEGGPVLRDQFTLTK